MRKVCSWMILSLCFLIFCFGGIGCGDYSALLPEDAKKTGIDDKAPVIPTSASIVHVDPSDPKEDISYFICLPSSDGEDSFDYSPYLKKIWLVDDFDGDEVNGYHHSFLITKIKNGTIEGQFGTGYVVERSFYFNKFYDDSISLVGTIHDGLAECQFFSEYQVSGNITLRFLKNNMIEAMIEYKENHLDIDFQDGDYFFRPYHFSDIKGTDSNNTRLYTVDLDSWGIVNVVTTVVRGWKEYPEIYLTTEEGDVLYRLGAPFPNGFGINDVVIEDSNGDGLKDIFLSLGVYDYDTCTIDTGPSEIEWLFLQMEDGLFYDSRL